MAEYTVKSGQNIYDVALTLYGSVEGIWDLFASNEWLTFNTPLKTGMTLNHTELCIVNPGIAEAIRAKSIKVRHGENALNRMDIKDFVIEHFTKFHKDMVDIYQATSIETLYAYYESVASPTVILKTTGFDISFDFNLKNNRHLFVDWGEDLFKFEVFEGVGDIEANHSYQCNTEHMITLYGDFDLKDIEISSNNHFEIFALKTTNTTI